MLGVKDTKSVNQNGDRFDEPRIVGVRIIKLNNVLTRSGVMNEVFRSDWFEGIKVKQINWVEMNPGGVTDWHCHQVQTDRLIGVSGTIKLCLFDGREDSPTHGAVETVRFGIKSPKMVIFPPGVWHGLRNESGGHAGYLNILEELYVHENPDNYRLPHDAINIPVPL